MRRWRTSARTSRRTAGASSRAAASTSLDCRFAPRNVEVEVLPRELIEGVVLVTKDPWIDEHGFITVSIEFPRGVRGHELGHLLEQLRALGRVRELPRPVIELVEFRQIEAR